MPEQTPSSVAALSIERIIHRIECAYSDAERLRSVNARGAAMRHQFALASQMVLELGLRPAVLATIDVRTDLRCGSSGNVEAICMTAGRSTKNGCWQCPLSEGLRERLQRHLEVHWPRLAGNSSLLFPSSIEGLGVYRIRRAITEVLLTSNVRSGDVEGAQ